MKNNPLNQLEKLGQSIWLDYIRRDIIPKLKTMIEDDGLRGMTSNPAIFKEAIAGSGLYDVEIQSLALKGMDAAAIYGELSRRDVRMACDEFRSVYDKTDAKDGYVSLEVNPHLAHDTGATIEEARKLWGEVDRPNICIKVPATPEGIPAITELIAEGINVNVTLIFGLKRYQSVAQAYVDGVEKCLTKGKDAKRVASVASFFVSRIDTLIDPMLEKIIAQGGADAAFAAQVLGQVAIANAKLAYQMYKEIFGSFRFKRLEKRGARVQRVLWASTGVKNPDFKDVKYVEALIGPNTVNTVPVETLNAFRDHGVARSRLEEDLDKAADVIDRLPDLGIDFSALTKQLEDEGVDKFNKPFDKLLEELAVKARPLQPRS
jgi:transaldolase